MFTGPAGRGVFEGLLRPPRLRDPLLGSPQRALSSYLFVAAVTRVFLLSKIISLYGKVQLGSPNAGVIDSFIFPSDFSRFSLLYTFRVVHSLCSVSPSIGDLQGHLNPGSASLCVGRCARRLFA